MDWTLQKTAAGRQAELPHSEQGSGKLSGCCLWRPLKLALLTRGWNPCTSATGGRKKKISTYGEIQAHSAPVTDRNLTVRLTVTPLAQRKALHTRNSRTLTGLLEQLTTGQWPIKGMGMLGRIKSLLLNIRPTLLFSKRKLQSTPAHSHSWNAIYFFYAIWFSCLSDTNCRATQTAVELFRWPVVRKTQPNSFPFALQYA